MMQAPLNGGFSCNQSWITACILRAAPHGPQPTEGPRVEIFHVAYAQSDFTLTGPIIQGLPILMAYGPTVL